MLHQMRLHFSEFLRQQSPFFAFLCAAVKQMEVTFFCIRFKELSFYRCSVNIIIIDVLCPFVLEASFHLQNQRIHQFIHSFYHDHKVIPVFIHTVDVIAAEVSPIQYKINLFITISRSLPDHKF